MKLFKYKPWNRLTEDTIVKNSIFYPTKARLNDPAELIHPVNFEDTVWHQSFQNAHSAVSDSTRAMADKINAKFRRLEALLA